MKTDVAVPPDVSRPRWMRRAEAILIGAALLPALTQLWLMICTLPSIPWSAYRITPAAALVRGLPIYYVRESGVQLGWFYGPVFPLWYLPVAWVENPTAMLVLAAVWNILTFGVPTYLCLRAGLDGDVRLARRVLLISVPLLLAHQAVQSGIHCLHVDAVALALGFAGCLALHARAVRGWQPGLPLAALAVVLSCFTKQLAVVLVPATCVWLWREGHRALLPRWIFWLAACGGGVALGFMMFFGAEELLFNLWLVHARTPFEDGWQHVLGVRLWQLFEWNWVWLLALTLGAWWLRPTSRDDAPALVTPLIRLLAWCAVWHLPLGIIAAMKLGGGVNSIYSMNYAMVAGLILLGRLWRARDAGRVAAGLGLAWLAVVLALATIVGGARLLARKPESTLYRGQEELVAMARANIGRIYLPWNPLTTVITERRVYPFDDALVCLDRARLLPPADAVRAAVPKGAFLFYHDPSQSYFALRYFKPDAVAQPPGRP